MGHSVKVAVSLPEGLLGAAEREGALSGESRSEIFRRALNHLIETGRGRPGSWTVQHSHKAGWAQQAPVPPGAAVSARGCS